METKMNRLLYAFMIIWFLLISISLAGFAFLRNLPDRWWNIGWVGTLGLQMSYSARFYEGVLGTILFVGLIPNIMFYLSNAYSRRMKIVSMILTTVLVPIDFWAFEQMHVIC